MPPPALRRIDALIATGLGLARTAKTGRVALARAADAVDLAWIPRPWGDEIAAELSAAAETTREPMSGKQVERVLREAWGGKPTQELDDLDLDPMAVTPTAQVHRGELEGEPVAVKVLRPGLASAVRQDLVLLDTLLRPLGAAFPALDAAAVVRELRERVLEELDLEHEASVQRRFHRALRDHPAYVVPEPATRLSHESVLVSAWVEGVPLDRADDRDAAAARLLVYVLGAGRFGTVHALASPEDVLVLPDARLALLDFGVAHTVAPERAQRAAAALDAFAERDGAGVGAELEELGWLPAAEGPAALELAVYALGELAEPGARRLDGQAVIAARDRALERPDALADLIVRGSLPPGDLWPARALGQVFGLIARVGATADWLGLARAAAHEGWDAAP